MAESAERLTTSILRKLGATSLTDMAELFPSALTTDVHINTAEKDFEDGKIEETFHKLSLTHSTLLHQRMLQRLHKPSQKGNCESAVSSTPDTLAIEKITLATIKKAETIDLLQKLPSDWTIVQITTRSIGEAKLRQAGCHPSTPGLYIARCSCGPTPSVVIQTISAPKKEGVRGILQELELIKEENKVINKDYREQYEKYWKKREELDSRLRCVVRSMDVAWLRYWCCLLVGGLPPREQKLLEETTARIFASSQTSLTSNQKQLLQCLISCPQPEGRGRSLEGGMTYSLQAAIAAVLGDSVRSQSVKQLYKAVQEESVILDELRRAERNPVILVLDKSIVTLPWEMIWVLKNQAVTRMPSLRMISLLYEHHASRTTSVLVQGIDPNKGFYVLDPENNLPRTQGRLKDSLAETGWSGITAKRPSHEQFKDALTSQDIFVFVGHGSGSQYMPGEVVEGVECRAIVILYGCSSVRLASRGRIPDPWGVVLNYLIAYCPCIIGMLWDVTDKDTDKLTQEMFLAIRGENGPAGTALEKPPSDVALLVARARSLCKWYLTRAALSVYGLPLHFVNNSCT